MRLVSLKKFADSEVLASLGRTASGTREFLAVAAGAVAMLLVVGIFELFGLLP